MQQITKQKVIIITLLMLFMFTGIIQAAGNEIRDMNFKGADIRDVLRAVAEVAEVNLVTDGSVNGSITIHLKNISFQKALDLITQSHGLDYKWDENTVVVATPERIKDIYEEKNIEIKVLKNDDLQRIKNIVLGIYPDLNIQTDNSNEQLILVGSEDKINKALNLIDKIKSPAVESEKDKLQTAEENALKAEILTEIITLKYADPVTISKNIKEIYSDLKISTNSDNKQIIIHGQKENVEKAVAVIERLDISSDKDEPEEKRAESDYFDDISDDTAGGDIAVVEPGEDYTEKIMIKDGDLAELKKEILNIEPELNILIDSINEQLIISGTDKEDVKNAAVLAKKWENKQAVKTEIIRVDYVDRNNIKSIVNSLHPGINLNINEGVREVIIRGNSEEIEEVVSLIEKLDVPRRQVVIEARVEEISRSDLMDIGVNPEKFTSIHLIKDSNNQITDAELTWPDFLRATDKEGTSETLANPHLMTLNGEEASILIGDRIPFEIPESDGDMRVKYEEVGIKLNFTPWITKNNEIELELRPEVSSLGEERANGYNVIQTREVTTNVRLKDGETFAIGGLIQENTLESMQKVPFLSEIPILGELFKQRKSDLQKTELLIFITPRIIDNSPEGESHKVQTDNSATIEAESEPENNKKKVDEAKNDQKETASVELSESKIGYDILQGSEVEKVINYSRRKRVYNTDDGLPVTLNLFYTVEQGETVTSIANKFAISPQDIIDTSDINSGIAEGNLVTLTIPHRNLYRISWGETLYQIAKRYNIELEKLLEVNRIAGEKNIPGGFIIILP